MCSYVPYVVNKILCYLMSLMWFKKSSVILCLLCGLKNLIGSLFLRWLKKPYVFLCSLCGLKNLICSLCGLKKLICSYAPMWFKKTVW